jgi:hypothetical protein
LFEQGDSSFQSLAFLAFLQIGLSQKNTTHHQYDQNDQRHVYEAPIQIKGKGFTLVPGKDSD